MINRFALSFLCIELDRNVRFGVTLLYILLRFNIAVTRFDLIDINIIVVHHPYSHLHSPVQLTPAVPHLQFPVQDLSQLQCKRMEQALLSSSSVVHYGYQIPFS